MTHKGPHRKPAGPSRRLLPAIAVLAAIVGIGTVGFVLLEGHSALDALYMTLVTISTLGMKTDQAPMISSAGKVWVMLLIVVGIASAMIAMTILAGMVVEGQVRSILGRRQLNQKIASLSGHTIVCGYGRMGREVCNQLGLQKEPSVVIDHDSKNTALAEQDGWLYVLGEAGEESVLRDAGIERARALVAVLPTDAENVFVALIARDLNPKVFIASRAERPDSEARMVRAGANTSICPQVISAKRVANMLTRPGVVDFIDFAAEGLDLEAELYKIPAGSKLVGQSLRQVNLPRQIGVLVIALRCADGKTVFNPEPDTVLNAADTMIITGRAGSMAKLEQQYS